MKDLVTKRKHLGIIGRRLGHTMSPLMHTTAFKLLNLDYDYGVFDIEGNMLPQLISSIRKRNFRGANVTVPYKKSVLPYLDSLSDDSKEIGAVNTIINNNGSLEGYNTDSFGIEFSLRQYKTEIKGKDIIVFGAGGAARAVLFALSKSFSPQSICIVNRTVINAKLLTKEFGEKFSAIQYHYSDTEQKTIEYLNASSLIVNTTTVGMKPNNGSHPLPPGYVIKNTHIIFDIVYNPLKTELNAMAERAGARTISGLEMLLGQGDAAFKLFTGNSFPIDAVRETVSKELIKDTDE